MPMKPRYRVYDTAERKWLSAYHKPVHDCDAAVTRWTRDPDKAMKFPGAKSARGVAKWLDANSYGGCMVINARGEAL